MAGSGRVWPEHDETASGIITDSPEESLSHDKQRLMQAWLPVLTQLGITERQGENIAARAGINKTSFTQELLYSGKISESTLFQAIAVALDLPFIEKIHPDTILINEERKLASLCSARGLRIAPLHNPRSETLYVIADPGLDLVWLKARLARVPHLRRTLCIAPPSVLRQAIIESCQNQLLFNAQHELSLRFPEFSARTVVTAWQGGAVVAAAFIFITCLWLARMPTLIGFYSLASACFAACVVLRLLAYGKARPLRLRHIAPIEDSEHVPVYSVLIALYREREVLPQLIQAIDRLQWPRAKLEIKLVCEADDADTLKVLHSLLLGPCIEIVQVPPGTPRTKPKALAYALPLCSGEFVTLYDAEDRPDPMQLVEAWRRFGQDGPDIACLQAPLVITNGASSLLARMFAFEYAGLFRGLLPWLASHRLVLPLGGTSNHFRRAALEEIGGWDGYNVTEDADLGVRLGRYGYRSGVITRPTYEDAPETISVWLPQRVRWFKGWLQTGLVHMREPTVLWRELGPASFLTAQIMSFGMFISALVHPIFVASIIYALGKAAWADELDDEAFVLAVIGFINILCGYGVFILLGMATLLPAEKLRPLQLIAFTPVHWLLLSVAAWVALWEIYRRPHHWSKTPHLRRAIEGSRKTSG